MKLIITEEDHQLIETIVERFNPERVISRPEGISDSDWKVYLENHRIELRQEVEAAVVGKALRLADASDDQIQADVVSLFGYDRVGYQPFAEYARVLEHRSLAEKEAAQIRSDELSANIDQAVAVVWNEPVLATA